MDKKVICITGTSKGIGRNLVDHYLTKGFAVVGCSRTSLENPPEGYTHYELDVADEQAVVEFFSSIEDSFGRCDILINNAGIATMNHFLLTPGESMRKIMETNVLGTALCSREAAKLMRKQNFGRIVNLATVATPLKLEGEALYAASKAAVVSLTEILSKELASFGITVNAVGPTPIETDLIRTVPKEKIDALLNRQAIPRLGNHEEIAHAIDFFIDDASGFITGQTLYLGGV